MLLSITTCESLELFFPDLFKLLGLKDLDSARCCSVAMHNWIARVPISLSGTFFRTLRSRMRQLETSVVLSLAAKILLDGVLEARENQEAWSHMARMTEATTHTLRDRLLEVQDALVRAKNVAPEDMVPSDSESDDNHSLSG